MKPLNLDNSPCSPISSNCVIWQGPNIPCIKLCTGDSITDVVYALATELCTIVDAANISTLDLSCLNITTGTPSNLNQLLQILIDKICELNNVSTTTSTKRGNTSCPTDCIVPVAACLQTNGQTTMKLLDYVQFIGNKICTLVSEIETINNSITNLTNRVTALESVPPTPGYILPSFAVDCTLSGDVLQDNSYQLDVILEALVNNDSHGYCALLYSLGEPNAITTAYGKQTILGSDIALSDCALTLEQLFGIEWISSPENLSQSFIDLWYVVKDIRDAYKTYNVVSGGSNVTVTKSTTTGTCGPEVSFSIEVDPGAGLSGRGIAVFSQSTEPNQTDFNTQYANKEGFTVNFIPGNNQIKPGDIWIEPCA
jgi:hypothetical protein